MTRVATGDVAHAANVVFFYQRCTEIDLIGITVSIYHHRMGAGRWLVTHIENLIARTKIILRRAMTAKAPLHLQGFLLIHQRHLVDGAVAGIASHTLRHVNAVIEKDEIGQLIHPRPLQRLARAVAGTNGLQQLGIGPDLRMAVHAGFGGRNSSEAGGFYRSVAITAVNAEASNMVLVAERHRLRLAHPGISDVRRALNLIRHPAERGNYEDRAKNRGPGQCVRTAMKDLRHAYVRILKIRTSPADFDDGSFIGYDANENTHIFFRVS